MIDNSKIDLVVQTLVATYEPQSIYLFGSYAWGHPNDDSDIDLMIIVKESSEKPHQRLKPAYRALRGLKVPKDILVYTEKEFEQQADEPASLFFKIKNEGVKLFEAA
jgi:predicted nucleotidyltransferase